MQRWVKQSDCHREVVHCGKDADKVLALAEDILENGQKVPIRVRKDAKGYVLIEGFHRLEAMRALGEETIRTYIVSARQH